MAEATGQGPIAQITLDTDADVRDFMGSALAAGERRLPTDDELQQMEDLAAALKVAVDNAPALYRSPV